MSKYIPNANDYLNGDVTEFTGSQFCEKLIGELSHTGSKISSDRIEQGRKMVQELIDNPKAFNESFATGGAHNPLRDRLRGATVVEMQNLVQALAAVNQQPKHKP